MKPLNLCGKTNETMKISDLKNNEPFSVRTYHFLSAHDQWYRVEGILCAYCRNGKLGMNINSRKYVLKSYSLAVCFSGKLIRFEESSRDMEIVLMIFPDELLADIRIPCPTYLILSFLQNPCLTLNEKQITGIENTVRSIEKIYNDNNNCFRLQIARLYIENYFLEICDKIKYVYPSVPSRSASYGEDLCVRFLQSVSKNYMHQRAPDFYAAELQISGRLLYRVVKAVTGTTPRNIINSYVIEETKTLLKHTRQSLHEISIKLSFGNGTTFSRFFKRETGMPPYTYR